ncbi:hypothetical protein FH972_011047 [Carpinus fangiana]|uniref:PGG domain-containing protein n=1 Tax=Carpinus fangiana TaxID=176857 RepID=A0A660KT41_9ROSI|nr:hypothetical protein FH972_011047 [Carpinus fangiana]
MAQDPGCTFPKFLKKFITPFKPPLPLQERLPNDMRSVILVAVALIAAATFQAGVSPPGGVWQDNNDGHVPGRAVYSSQPLHAVFSITPYEIGTFRLIALVALLPLTLRLAIYLLCWIISKSSCCNGCTKDFEPVNSCPICQFCESHKNQLVPACPNCQFCENHNRQLVPACRNCQFCQNHTNRIGDLADANLRPGAEEHIELVPV